jgi:hypothetical protein
MQHPKRLSKCTLRGNVRRTAPLHSLNYTISLAQPRTSVGHNHCLQYDAGIHLPVETSVNHVMYYYSPLTCLASVGQTYRGKFSKVIRVRWEHDLRIFLIYAYIQSLIGIVNIVCYIQHVSGELSFH